MRPLLPCLPRADAGLGRAVSAAFAMALLRGWLIGALVLALPGGGAVAGAPGVAASAMPGAATVALAAEGPRVRFAPEADYGPFIYRTEDGRIDGLSMDWLRRLAPLAGWQLEVLPARPLAENLAAAQRGEVDLLSSLRPTPERAAYLGFTRAYAVVPAVLVWREHEPAVALSGLGGQPVAVGQGYAVEAHVRRHYPQVRWQAVSDDVQALQQLQRGQVRAAVMDVASARFVMARQVVAGLLIGEPIGFDYQLCFAFRKDRPQLGAALERAMAALPAAEARAITTRWMPPALTEVVDPLRARLQWVGLSVLLVAAIGAWLWWRAQGRRSAPALLADGDAGTPGRPR